MYLLSEKIHSRMDLIPPLLPSLSHQLGTFDHYSANCSLTLCIFPM